MTPHDPTEAALLILAAFALFCIAVALIERYQSGRIDRIMRRVVPRCELCGDTEDVLMLMNGGNICVGCKEELAEIMREP